MSSTLTTVTIFSSCRRTCSSTRSSPTTTNVIRESCGSSVSPTAKLSMLYPRDASIPEMCARTPGTFCTTAEITCRMSKNLSTGVIQNHSPQRRQSQGTGSRGSDAEIAQYQRPSPAICQIPLEHRTAECRSVRGALLIAANVTRLSPTLASCFFMPFKESGPDAARILTIRSDSSPDLHWNGPRFEVVECSRVIAFLKYD